MVFVSAQKSGCNIFCRMKTRCVDNEVVTTRQMFHSLCDGFRIILSSWEPYIKTVTQFNIQHLYNNRVISVLKCVSLLEMLRIS